MNHLKNPARREAADPYLRAQVMSAAPQQLHVMLLDGAIRFAEQGRTALEEADYDRSFDLIRRSRRIVEELSMGLRPSANAELASNLRGLYDFVFGRLVRANTEHDVAAVDEALSILRHQRQTWAAFVAKLDREGTAPKRPAAEQAGKSRLSLCA